MHNGRRADRTAWLRRGALPTARAGRSATAVPTRTMPTSARRLPTANAHRHPTVRPKAGTASPPSSVAIGIADCLTAKARPWRRTSTTRAT